MHVPRPHWWYFPPSATLYIHCRATFSISLLRIGASRGTRSLVISAFLAVFANENATSLWRMREYLQYHTGRASNATFFLLEGTTRKRHCFFEGSVQLREPKSTGLPDGPFRTSLGHQLRRSRKALTVCTQRATFPASLAACAGFKCLFWAAPFVLRVHY